MPAKRILLTSIGTRGDVEPFIAVGEILAKRGFAVWYSFPEQFSELLPAKANHYPLSKKMVELIQSEEGRTVMGKAGLWRKLSALLYLYKEGKKVNATVFREQHDLVQKVQPDLIIHHAKCGYPVLWGLTNHKPTIVLSPIPYLIHYVKGRSHIGFQKDYGTLINRLTYRLANYGLVKTISSAQDAIAGSRRHSFRTIREAILQKKIIYAISPNLFPQPAYWPQNARVFGFCKRSAPSPDAPNEGLERFVHSNPKFVFLTFGSMVSTEPETISRCLYRRLDELGIPTLVNTAAGGLMRLREYESKENFLFVDSIPYDWILSKAYAAIHHGGSGTTHIALAHGCPSLIVPHVIDQFVWGDVLHKKGVGPKSFPLKKLPSEKIKESIADLYHNAIYKKQAVALSKRMEAENLEESMIEFLEEEWLTRRI